MENDDDADADSFLPQVLLIVVLTLVNAFFASAEMAVIQSNKSKIKRLASEGNKKAKALEKLASDETKFLSTIQVGITLAGFFSSATAAVNLSDDFGSLLASINIPYANDIAVVIVTVVLSYFTLVFGELLPKRIALRNPEKLAMQYAKSLLLIKAIATPFVKLLSGSCNLLVKILGLNRNVEEEKVSDNDIIDVVTSGVEDGSVDADKLRIIESTLTFYHLTATDLMTPRVDVFMIDIEDDEQENIQKMLSEKYTRVPVYRDDRDKVIGVVNVKDMLDLAYAEGFKNIKIENLIREPFFVREYIEAHTLFREMKSNNEQIAFLLDEFGGFSGIVTMEDLIEEIVGNINDEFDDDQPITKVNDTQYVVKGTLPIHELNQELDIELDEENNEYDTVAGLVVTKINRIPTEEDLNIEVQEENIVIKILEVDDNRINKVQITIVPKIESEEE